LRASKKQSATSPMLFGFPVCAAAHCGLVEIIKGFFYHSTHNVTPPPTRQLQQRCLRMMKWILRQIFERVAQGASTVLRVVFADCTIWQPLQGEPEVIIVFRTSAAERRTVLLGYVGFFEAYFAVDVDIDGE